MRKSSIYSTNEERNSKVIETLFRFSSPNKKTATRKLRTKRLHRLRVAGALGYRFYTILSRRGGTAAARLVVEVRMIRLDIEERMSSPLLRNITENWKQLFGSFQKRDLISNSFELLRVVSLWKYLTIRNWDSF